MQVRNGQTGEIIEVPDGTPDDDIHAQFSGQSQMNGPSLAQSFAQTGQQAIPQLAQRLIQGPEQSTLPNIGGGAMVGLTPQQAQFTLQQAQSSNVDSMENRIRQQQMVQQSLENEKDRAQTLKLEQQSLKNRIAETKVLADQAKFEAEQKAKIAEFEEAGVTTRRLAELKTQAEKPMNVSKDGAIWSPTEQREIYRNPGSPEPPKPPALTRIETMENGVPVNKFVSPTEGASYPTVPDSGPSTDQFTERDWSKDGKEILKEAMALELQEAKDKDPTATINPAEWYAVNEPRYRQGEKLPPFKNAAAEAAFRKATTEMALRQIMKGKTDAEIVGGGLNEFRKQAKAAADYEANMLKVSEEMNNALFNTQREAAAKGVELAIKFAPDGTPFLEAQDENISQEQLVEMGF